MRQGDPISPLLFNIIFDPFLRAIKNHPDILGFDFQHIAYTNHSSSSPPLTEAIPTAVPVKVLAYADDTLVFLNDLREFNHIRVFLRKYANASDASLNYQKTQA